MSLNVLYDASKIMQLTIKKVSKHKEYKFSLNDQILRSCYSIGSNIAEGNERVGKDRKHFFDIALGSLEEYRFQINAYPDDEDLEEINALLDKIRAITIKLKSPTPTSTSTPIKS